MQKFVCRQATDVSQLLPIPIPSNSRQEKNMKQMRGLAATENKDLRREQCMKVMATLGKVHGIMFAVKQTAAPLYSEFLSTLGLSDGGGNKKSVSDAIPEAAAEVAAEIEGVDEARLKRQMTCLSSPHSALPFSIVNHGNVR